MQEGHIGVPYCIPPTECIYNYFRFAFLLLAIDTNYGHLLTKRSEAFLHLVLDCDGQVADSLLPYRAAPLVQSLGLHAALVTK